MTLRHSVIGRCFYFEIKIKILTFKKMKEDNINWLLFRYVREQEKKIQECLHETNQRAAAPYGVYHTHQNHAPSIVVALTCHNYSTLGQSVNHVIAQLSKVDQHRTHCAVPLRGPNECCHSNVRFVVMISCPRMTHSTPTLNTQPTVLPLKDNKYIGLHSFRR